SFTCRTRAVRASRAGSAKRSAPPARSAHRRLRFMSAPQKRSLLGRALGTRGQDKRLHEYRRVRWVTFTLRRGQRGVRRERTLSTKGAGATDVVFRERKWVPKKYLERKFSFGPVAQPDRAAVS